MPVDVAFLDALRDALSHLYDPDFLRRSPLAGLFGVAGRYDAASALRRLLTEAIESLEPPADEPPYSRAWRMYGALHYLYVQQMRQEEAADQLAISSRQLRREQIAAIEALGSLLWERCGLEQKRLAAQQGTSQPSPQETGSTSVKAELAWLKDARQTAHAELAVTLRGVLELAWRIAEQYQVRLDVAMPGLLPRLAVHPVALRQILLSLLRLAISRAAGGTVHVSGNVEADEVQLSVHTQSLACASSSLMGTNESSLGMVQELLDLCRCRLDICSDPDRFQATLHLPVYERLPVLAVDDNADTLQLLQRYTADTRYRLVVTDDPEQILTLVEKYEPQAIVLDVMMPEVDGWEVLARLRQHPRTAGLPIVICSVLTDEDLALTLGATAAVRKPVTKQVFLGALDQALGATD